MPAPVPVEAKEAPKYPLAHEPANDAARTQADRNIRQVLNHNAAKPLTNVDGVPIQKREYVGAQLDLIGPQEEKDRKAGKYFLVAEQTQRGHTAQVAYPAVLPPDLVARLDANKGTAADMETLRAAIGIIRTVASENNAELTGPITIGRPQDCLQFVNGAIASNSIRDVNPNTGVELNAALAAGKAAVELKPHLAKPNAFKRPPFSYTEGVEEFTKQARQGDVVIFLDEKHFSSLKDARAWEAQAHDQVVWLDKDNKPIDTSAMKDKDRPAGTPFVVGHTSVYSGAVDGKPTIAQSHIGNGEISTLSISDYLHGWVNSAIAIIPLDYFTKANP
jgi:hypothetical protein